LAVGLLWLAGLLIIGVPWAPVWAILGGLLQFVPHLGTVLALVAPAVLGFARGGFTRLLQVLVLYAGIVLAEAFLLQPLFMKRRARVPIWASLAVPLVLGSLFSFWGVFLAPPFLAIIFAYRERLRRRSEHGVGQKP
jgi:predicted PurR-regulated permease PerM